MNTHEEVVSTVTKGLADEGKLIESGFNVLRELMIPSNASEEQVTDMRIAYMAGAQHLWGSIMISLDPGTKETPGDLERMDKIHAELESWRQTLKLRFSTGAGGKQ